MSDLETEQPLPPSKSARKREAQAIFELAAELACLSEHRIRQLPVEEPLRVLIRKVKGIRSHVARKRETQFLAKQLRNLDLTPLLAVVRPDAEAQRQEQGRLHLLEHWRDRLLEEGDAALAEALRQFPGLEPQPVRALLRQAAKERASAPEALPPAARKLFQLLKAHLPETGDESAE